MPGSPLRKIYGEDRYTGQVRFREMIIGSLWWKKRVMIVEVEMICSTRWGRFGMPETDAVKEERWWRRASFNDLSNLKFFMTEIDTDDL